MKLTDSVIAGFFTGGSLAIRGGYKAARNSAIGCACLLAVIEGVGIGFQRMMAESSTKLEVCRYPFLFYKAFLTFSKSPLPPPPAEAGKTGFPAVA